MISEINFKKKMKGLGHKIQPKDNQIGLKDVKLISVQAITGCEGHSVKMIQNNTKIILNLA